MLQPLNRDLFKVISFWIVLLLTIALFVEFSRLGLPEIKGPGHKDTQSLTLFLLGCVLLLLAINNILSRAGICFVFLFLSILSLSNWWFYDFYRDFLTLDTLKLAIFAKETALSWKGLKYKQEILILLGSTILCLVLLFNLQKYKPSNKTLIITGILTISLGIHQQYQYLGREVGGLKHKGTNHITYFFKSFFPAPEIKITPKTMAELSQALPEKDLSGNSKKFPLYQPSKISDKPERIENVILVVLESVRAAETGLFHGSKESITPNLDRFAKKSINVVNYYANSNQTVRGEVAILCSVLDYINGAPFSMSGDKLPANCLPSILAHYGYETLWIHGYEQKFFNRKSFFPLLGFQQLHDIAVINRNSDKNLIGWGVSDPEVFAYAIDTLENTNKPFFAEILTLSNHYPYLWNWNIEFPENLQLPEVLDAEVDNIYPAYRRGIHYTDSALGQFLVQFEKSRLAENTLLIITGDHGIWTFPEALMQEKTINAELKRNEIYFRLPLLIHGPKLSPGTIQSPASQVDIAPTVLEYLGIKVPNAFLGSSLLNRNPEGSYPVYFMASGSFGVRRDNQYCYPIDMTGSCTEHYRKCESSMTVSETTSICVKSKEELLATKKPINLIEVDQSNDKTLIDMTQYLLNHGYLPEDELL